MAIKKAEFFYKPEWGKDEFNHNSYKELYMNSQLDALKFSLCPIVKEFNNGIKFSEKKWFCKISFKSTRSNHSNFQYALFQHLSLVPKARNDPYIFHYSDYSNFPHLIFANHAAEEDVVLMLNLYNKTLTPNHPNIIFSKIQRLFKVPRKIINLENEIN
ncbi:MAG: hypothetical protein PVJ67_01790 [Candidatus Pacearchaeota archaeon]